MHHLDRRTLGLLVLSAGVVAAGKASAAFTLGDAAPLPREIFVGQANASQTVVEYFSPGSKACGDWHRQAFPEVKKQLIDSGRVRWVLRETTLGDREIAIRGLLLARYVAVVQGADKYLPVIDSVFAVGDELRAAPNQQVIFRRIAHTFGFDDVTFDECMNDMVEVSRIALRSAETLTSSDGASIQGVPAFVVGGEKFEGSDTSYATILSALDRAEAA